MLVLLPGVFKEVVKHYHGNKLSSNIAQQFLMLSTALQKYTVIRQISQETAVESIKQPRIMINLVDCCLCLEIFT